MNSRNHSTHNEYDSSSESSSYSGLASEGLTHDHSYDRMLYTSEQNIIGDTQEIIDLVNNCLSVFNTSERSRLLMRFKVYEGIDLDSIYQAFENAGIELACYPNGAEGIQRITIGFNKKVRQLDEENIQRIHNVVRQKIEKAINAMPDGDFETFALEQLDQCETMGLSFCNANFTADELYNLWHEPFGWTREQCEEYAEKSQPRVNCPHDPFAQQRALRFDHIPVPPQSPQEQIFGMRNRDGELVAGMLFSHNESTEWATLPEYQGQGLIVPLLTYANAHLMQQNIPEIFAELRFDRSVTAAVKSGMRIHLDKNRQSLLLNQVSIGGSPDSWNEDLPDLSDGTPGPELRSFVLGTVDPNQITERVREAYVQNMAGISPHRYATPTPV